MHRVSNHANKFDPQSKNSGSIMRGFKSSVTIYSKNQILNFDGRIVFMTTLFAARMTSSGFQITF
jgi:hypothetical protein